MAAAPHPLANVKPDPWMYRNATAMSEGFRINPVLAAYAAKLTEQEMKPNGRK
jgi:hypothetical protein